MSPRSLLFSSDQETSRQIAGALEELRLGTEGCAEIFAALKTLTSKAFRVIVIDWDEGLEASFLLKTARELRINQNIFAIVVGKKEASAALEQAGADLVLSKPLSGAQVKHALLSCPTFVLRLKEWSPRALDLSNDFPSERFVKALSPSSDKPVSGWPVLADSSKPNRPPEVPVDLHFATFEDGLSGESVFGKLSRRNRAPESWARFGLRASRNPLLRVAVIGVVFFAVSYVLSQPISQMFGTVARASRAAHHQPLARNEAFSIAVRPRQVEEASDSSLLHDQHHKIRVEEVRRTAPEPAMSDIAPIAQAAALQEEEPMPASQPPVTTARAVTIPESIGSPFPGITQAQEVAAKTNPALMDALEPIMLPGTVSDKLLLEKSVPSYPERALQAGLRGPVILQALIGKDGKVQELKLIRGPLLLGEAAFDAVRNWRYQPYVQNGRAVQAQTLLTVDFKLP